MKLELILVLLAFSLGGCSLVQPSDGGTGMENPDANKLSKELVQFDWTQTSLEQEECFNLEFYLEEDYPTVKGSYYDASAESNVDVMPTDLTWTIWYDLQNTLDEIELPNAQEDTTSKITIVWRNADNTTEAIELDGGEANDLKEKVLSIVSKVNTENN